MSDAELWLVVWRDICAVLARRKRGDRNYAKSEEDMGLANNLTGHLRRSNHSDRVRYHALTRRIHSELQAILARDPNADLDQLILNGLRVAHPNHPDA